MTVAARPVFDLDDSFARSLHGLHQPWSGSPVADPSMVVLNEPLATELGLDVDALRSPAGVAVLAGNAAPDGVTSVAQAYAGHQFGGYSPRLGDGRALLLGEVVTADGTRRDLHLKGSGRTPFARGGDGRAALGPMLREFLIGEAMHALGIPTTRMLAVVATGEAIVREVGGRVTDVPGAVLTRVAASHLRVGTFQYASATGDRELLERLVEYAIARHVPAAADADRPALALFDHVVAVQAELVAAWMAVGFIHGVMNTDNVTISGETIDYGPCAFMDAYDPATVFSSIDQGGRYAYGNQPAITTWNLARLAESLLSQFDDDGERAVELATGVLESFPDRFRRPGAAGCTPSSGSPTGHPTVTR
jgi:serine/tyrosine/threonine adenylyltransferase